MNGPLLDRRTLLAGLAASTLAHSTARAAGRAVRDRLVDVGGGSVLVRDSGSSGPVIVLAHPATGSAWCWERQLPAFIQAGYRVIAWSRRGFRGSDSDPGSFAGDATAELDAIADALRLARFHALGSAAGGGVMLDYAVARPRRLLSLVVASSIGNVSDSEYRRRSMALRPAPFDELPAEVRELGPSFRAAEPAGVLRWLELQRQARTAPIPPPPVARTSWAEIVALPMPVLWLTGSADLFTPPPLLAEFHRRLKGSTMTVVEGAGHSAYWERPDAFNAAVLNFLKRHRVRGRAIR